MPISWLCPIVAKLFFSGNFQVDLGADLDDDFFELTVEDAKMLLVSTSALPILISWPVPGLSYKIIEISLTLVNRKTFFALFNHICRVVSLLLDKYKLVRFVKMCWEQKFNNDILAKIDLAYS